MYIFFFYILTFSELQLVYLASLRYKPNWMSKPVKSEPATNLRNIRKSKPMCGPVHFPDYSCEEPKPWEIQDKFTWNRNEKLHGETTTWNTGRQPTPWEPIGTLIDVILNENEEAGPNTRKSSVTFSEEPRTLSKLHTDETQTVTPYTATSHDETSKIFLYVTSLSSPSQNTASRSITPHHKRFRSNKPHNKQYPSKFHNKKNIQKNFTHNLEVLNILTSEGTTRDQEFQHVSKALTTKSLTTGSISSQSMTPRTVASLSPGEPAARKSKNQVVHRMIRTMSTYPPYPGGTTPKREATPTEILMCGIAKCLMMNWTDPEDEKKMLKMRAPSGILDDKGEDVILSDSLGIILDS